MRSPQEDLEMVDGTDKMLDALTEDDMYVTLEVNLEEPSSIRQIKENLIQYFDTAPLGLKERTGSASGHLRLLGQPELEAQVDSGVFKEN